MSSFSLVNRINDLSEANKQVVLLIQRLSKLQVPQPLSNSSSTLASASEESNDEARADLSAEIHETLKQQEEDLELLKQDVEDAYPSGIRAETQAARRASSGRESHRHGETGRESARLKGNCVRLEEDLKLARIRFRKAQLQAKRNAELAAERDRTLFLASLREQSPSPTLDSSSEPSKPARAPLTDLFAGRRSRKPGHATEDDILLSATSDVTASLRRTHDLLSSELSRSRFAHDTLQQSNVALEELNKQYRGLDDILATSRGLLGTLLRSQKSDTWYLETAFYLLLATIAWLVFRRLLYGPLWWLVWFPAKLLYRTVFAVSGTALGIAGAAGGKQSSTSSRPSLIVHQSATGRPPSFASSVPVVNVGYQPAGAGGANAKQGQGAFAKDIDDMVETAADAVKAALENAEQMKQEEQGHGSASEGAGQGEEKKEGDGKKPIIRGDGTVLPDRDQETQPVNPKKRVWEEPVAPRQEL